MAEDNSSSAGKAGESRTIVKSLTQAARRVLKRRPDSSSEPDDTWAEKLMIRLNEIACNEENPGLCLQAIKLTVEVSGEKSMKRRKIPKSDPNSDSDLIDGMSEEELDTEIAEIKAQLGSLPSSQS